jgi:hypothetical protein
VVVQRAKSGGKWLIHPNLISRSLWPSWSSCSDEVCPKKPCANCPFLKVGAISLRPGRLEGIIADLLADDHIIFQCHETVYCPKGGEWIVDEDGDERYYQASANESHCVGAMIYLLKARSPNVAMRLAAGFKLISFDALREQSEKVIDT